MSIVKITKEFRYEGAHALLNYNGKCKFIHGHSYKLYVTIKGVPCTDKTSSGYGMIMDFTELKRIVNECVIEKFDHALVLREDAPLSKEIAEAYKNVVIVNFQPTCENIISFYAESIRARLPKNVELFSLKLYETATSYVEWFAEDN